MMTDHILSGGLGELGPQKSGDGGERLFLPALHRGDGLSCGGGCIWLIGGTQESAELAHELVALGVDCLVSVTTETARSLYPDSCYLKVWVGALTNNSLPQFLADQAITAILDASHPFAVEISRLAIAGADQFQLPYLRYERPTAADFGSFKLHSFQSLLSSNLLKGQRVLLTTGYRSLGLFQPWQTQATLFARILPSVVALEGAISAGFTPDRIIALRPPISLDLERALWQQWHISLVVTKASGRAGGEDIKQQVAAELGVRLVVIARPEVEYPQQTSDVAEAIGFCQQHRFSNVDPVG
jgi:precorrin-6A/cobalt-precorrin-6A reductase